MFGHFDKLDIAVRLFPYFQKSFASWPALIDLTIFCCVIKSKPDRLIDPSDIATGCIKAAIVNIITALISQIDTLLGFTATESFHVFYSEKALPFKTCERDCR